VFIMMMNFGIYGFETISEIEQGDGMKLAQVRHMPSEWQECWIASGLLNHLHQSLKYWVKTAEFR
jgi:hypothetical protein